MTDCPAPCCTTTGLAAAIIADVAALAEPINALIMGQVVANVGNGAYQVKVQPSLPALRSAERPIPS